MKKGFLDSFFDVLGTFYFIKYILPVLLIILLILLGIAFGNKEKVKAINDPNTTILYTDFQKVIENIAQNNLNTNNFKLETKLDPIRNVELEYKILNNDLSVDEYESQIKDEITKIYNKIKDKKVVNDTLFGEDSIVNVDIQITVLYGETFENWVGFSHLKYDSSTGWENSYNEIINNKIIDSNDLNKLQNK